MNSENNLLPPFVIASLYKDELVLVDDQKSIGKRTDELNTKKSGTIAPKSEDATPKNQLAFWATTKKR